MLSKKNNRTVSPSRRVAHARKVVATSRISKTSSAAFFPLLFVVLLIWFLYRMLFHFPVWFDEIIGKAIFFGLPVSLYISLTGTQVIRQTYAVGRLYRGLLLGVLIGGVFGFAATLTSFLGRGVVVQAAPLFTSNDFWWQFFLALMTGFWESLFFFSWVMVVVQEKYRRWGIWPQLLLVAAIFVIFHLPNTILRAPSALIVVNQVILLSIFAVGQGLLFARTKNFYALAISQAIWGMVLLVHTSSY